MQIYVQIPAYRDHELGSTLLDLYAKADHPQDLRTCVLWQRGEETLPLEVNSLPNLNLLEIPYSMSRGANWARRHLQQHWQGEPYTLLLDSHHRFCPHWDSDLFDLYEECALRSPKPLVSTYLPAYDPVNEPAGREHLVTRVIPLRREEDVLVQLSSIEISDPTLLAAPIPAAFLGLHFLFAIGEINTQIFYDPKVYYLRDEVVASLQVFTWGYDVFHPHRILAWHAYDRSRRTPHWEDRPGWHVGQAASLDELRQLFLAEVPPPRGYLGPYRSVREFEDRAQTKLVCSRSSTRPAK
jgi:hypothetical protein